MKVYFVLDLLNGIVVRAFRGDRANYMPAHFSSKIIERSEPEYVVNVLKPKYLYVADLDRIMGNRDNFDSISRLSVRVEHLIADRGYKDLSELEGRNFKFDNVLGSETFNFRNLKGTIAEFVSLDIKDELLDASKSFNWEKALEFLNGCSLKGVIILTLSKVGTLSVDYDILSKAAEISEHPIYAGGGVRDMEDILRLKEMGYTGVLIASSVHEGIIGLDVVRKGRI